MAGRCVLVRVWRQNLYSVGPRGAVVAGDHARSRFELRVCNRSSEDAMGNDADRGEFRFRDANNRLDLKCARISSVHMAHSVAPLWSDAYPNDPKRETSSSQGGGPRTHAAVTKTDWSDWSKAWRSEEVSAPAQGVPESFAPGSGTGSGTLIFLAECGPI